MYIAKAVEKILKTGTGGVYDYRRYKAITVLNATSFFSIIVILLFMLFYVFTGQYLMLLSGIVPLFSTCSVLILNYYKKFQLSQFNILFFNNASLLFASYLLGADTLIHYLYFPFVLLTSLIYTTDDKLKLTLAMISNISIFVVIQLYRDKYFVGLGYIPVEYKTYFRMVFILTSMIFSGLCMFSLLDILDQYQFQILKDREHRIEKSKMTAMASMSAGIAHEVNNPLAVIRLSVEHIKNCLEENDESTVYEDPSLLKSLTRIKKNILRIEKIVQGMKDISHEKETDNFVWVDAKTVLDDAYAMCKDKILKNEISFSFAPVVQDIQTFCNPEQILQVLVNLINNAIDAIEPLKSRWVRVESSFEGDFLTLKVVDAGAGIPKEIRQSIMQPFFTTKEVGKGTGLGLSVTASIIKRHGGYFKIDEKHQNTCFVIKLPGRLQTDSA